MLDMTSEVITEQTWLLAERSPQEVQAEGCPADEFLLPACLVLRVETVYRKGL